MRGGRQAGDSSVTCRRAARLLPPLPAAIGETCARKTALRGSFLRFEVVMLSALFAMALPAFSFAWSQLWSVASRFRGRSSGQAKRPLNVKTCQRRRFFVRGCASGGPPVQPAQARPPVGGSSAHPTLTCNPSSGHRRSQPADAALDATASCARVPFRPCDRMPSRRACDEPPRDVRAGQRFPA